MASTLERVCKEAAPGWVSKSLGAAHGGARLCNCSSSSQEADRRVKSSRPASAVHKTLYSQKEQKLRKPI